MCAKGFFVRFERLLVLTLWVTPNYALKRAVGLVAPFACCYYMLVQYFMDEKKPTRYESAFFQNHSEHRTFDGEMLTLTKRNKTEDSFLGADCTGQLLSRKRLKRVYPSHAGHF